MERLKNMLLKGWSRREKKEYREKEAAKVKVGKLGLRLEKAKADLIAQQQLIARLGSKLEVELAKTIGKRVAEEAEDSKNSARKRFKYNENPFLIEKSSYSWRLFEVNNPFCEVHKYQTLCDMPTDKVTDGKRMNKDALSLATDILLEPIAQTRSQYKDAHTELGGRIIHASILRGIHSLTLPSGATKDCTFADAQFSAGGTEVYLKDEVPSHETNEIQHEGVDWDELVTLERFDLKGMHRDLSIEGDNFVTALIVECDWHSKEKKIFQGAAYAITAARQNFSKGCEEPIYVHQWSKESWRYGVLNTDGLVRVESGRVVDVEGDNIDGDKLQRHLDKCTRDFQEQYISPSQYPDGVYLLGSFHVCPAAEMVLPTAFNDRFLPPSSLLFLQSLIRIFLGDFRALSLTVDEIRKNLEKRQQEGKAILSKYKTTFDIAYADLRSTLRQ